MKEKGRRNRDSEEKGRRKAVESLLTIVDH